MSIFESIKTGLEESIAHEEGRINLSTETRGSDLIRRSDALKAIANDGDEHWWYEERINEVPAVDAVEVVRGHWIKVGTGYDGDEEYPIWMCSECGEEHLGHTPKFCSDCGIRMDGE